MKKGVVVLVTVLIVLVVEALAFLALMYSGGYNIGTSNHDNGAINYLSGINGFENRQQYPFPDLVLLDLNIPRVHGLKVLKWIREQPTMARLPVVVYTSSEQPKDVAAAQELGANDYQVKPSSIELIAEKVKGLLERWCDRQL